MRRFLSWLDTNILFLITGFLLAFIPLFPKLPLFDAIPGYIVRVRIEDFLVGFALIVWLVQLWRKKVSFGPNPLAKPIIAYLTIGILSMVSAVFITQTVPMESLHIGKMVLHFLRRVEYFSLFFVFYSSVKSLKQVKIYLVILLVTVTAVILYGYGQKYLYWPAFSTMNREFSKGWALYLTQHARVLSTFGGHYDLAAYIMVLLLFLWALFFHLQKLWQRAGIFFILAGAFWLLILTASRTSFLAYIAGVTVLFFLWMFRRGISWAMSRWIGVVVLSIVVMLLFGDLSDRFLKILKLDQRANGIKALITQPFGSPPKQSDIAFLENNIEAVTSKSDFPPLRSRPTDVTYEGADGMIATTSASGAAVMVEVPRTYSQTALVYDLSTGIRLDALWPRAIQGFLRNPLLGSGYSTLTKTQISEFTEAESTDNDFLRALGETGLLGFLAFGWILGVILVRIWRTFTSIKDVVLSTFVIGMFAGVIGLLINAVYIDIFEASKVAFSFWALTGIALGGIKVAKAEETKGIPNIPHLHHTITNGKNLIINIIKSYRTHLLLLVLLAFILRQHRIHEPLADWHSWRQADTSAVTRNYSRFGIDLFFPRYDDLSSIASGQPNPEGYRFVEFPIYNIASLVTERLFPGYGIEYAGRLTSVFASLGTLIFLALLVKKYLGVRASLLTAFFFAVLPYNIYWSRTVLPEPTLVFLTTGLVYFFDRWLQTEKVRFFVVAAVCAALALLVKFTAVFFAIPLVYLAYKKWGIAMCKNIWLMVLAVVTVVPFLAWRWHIGHYPEGIPAYTWLFNGNMIRFKGAWFWWLFAERISMLILGGWGVGLLIIGLVRRMGRTNTDKSPIWLFHWWLVGMIVYLVVFATGNVQHDYYQVILIPILTVFLGWGADALLRVDSKEIHPWLAKGALVITVLFILMFGWYQSRDFFNINHPEIVEAGRDFDRVVSNQQVRVIAPYSGDTAFLYQTGRKGWPIMEGTIDHMIELGAHYYISVNFDDLTNELLQTVSDIDAGIDHVHHYKVVKQTDSYVIIQLVADKDLPKN